MGKTISKKRAMATSGTGIKIGRGMKRDKFESIVTGTVEQSELVIESAVEEHNKKESAVKEKSLQYSTWDMVESAARFAVEEHNNNEKEDTLLTLNKVVNVEEFVVGGVKFHITLETNNAGLKNRKNKRGKDKLYYWAEVWVKPGNAFTEVMEFTFIGYTYGYKSEQSLRCSTWDMVESAARLAVEQHNNKKENPLLTLNKVVNVEEFVVGGLIFYITLEANNNVAGKTYYWASVFVRPWMNSMIAMEFKFIGYNYNC